MRLLLSLKKCATWTDHKRERPTVSRFLVALLALAGIAAPLALPSTAHAQARTIISGRDSSTGNARAFEVGPEGLTTFNTEAIAVLASAVRTTTVNSADVTQYSYRGVRLYLNISAASGTSPTLDIKLQEKDPASGNYVDVPGATFAQKTTTGADDLVIYPGATVTANRSVNTTLPRKFRVVSTIGGTSPSFTYSIGATFLD